MEEEWEVVYEIEETHRGYIRTIAELEAQNKVLTDMVEIQSEKISRLEAPKSCYGCKFSLDDNSPDMFLQICNKCSRNFDINDMYQSRDTNG